MELTATQILSLFNITKDERKSFAETIISAIKEGELNPLTLHLNMKKMEDTIKQIQSFPDYMSLIIDEATKYSAKSFELNNAKIEIKEVGVKYDYSVCEDAIYLELEAQKKDIETKMKERAKFLQMIPDGGIADPETGGIIYRAAKSSTTSAVVTLK